MHLKIQNGAVGVITQPVFDIENVKKLLENFENAKEKRS
jgi:5,10-methylenetetrahydrofolate reductase